MKSAFVTRTPHVYSELTCIFSVSLERKRAHAVRDFLAEDQKWNLCRCISFASDIFSVLRLLCVLWDQAVWHWPKTTLGGGGSELKDRKNIQLKENQKAKIMRITTDQSSKKQTLFRDLVQECQLAAPGSRLSEKLKKKIEEFGKDDRKDVVAQTAEGCAPLFLACKNGSADVVSTIFMWKCIGHYIPASTVLY